MNSETPITPETQSKKYLPFLLVGVGVLIFAILIAVIAFASMGVSKKDYSDAVSQYNTVSQDNTLLGTRATSLGLVSTGSDADFNSAVTKTEESITSIKEENKTLGEMKAVKKGDAVPLYKTFNEKLTAYLAYSESLVTSLKIARPAIVTCDKANDITDVTARTAALKDCSSQLAALKTMPNEEFNAYAKSLQKAYATYAKDYEALTQISDPYGAQYQQYIQLRDEVYSVQSDVTKANSDYKTATAKHADSVSVKDSATALSQFLQNNQR